MEAGSPLPAELGALATHRTTSTARQVQWLRSRRELLEAQMGLLPANKAQLRVFKVCINPYTCISGVGICGGNRHTRSSKPWTEENGVG